MRYGKDSRQMGDIEVHQYIILYLWVVNWSAQAAPDLLLPPARAIR